MIFAGSIPLNDALEAVGPGRMVALPSTLGEDVVEVATGGRRP